MTSPVPSATTTTRPSLLFVAASIWVAISLTAGRVVAAFASAAIADLVQQAATALFLFGGFYLIARSAVPDLRPLSSVGFVRRPGTEGEFGRGLALGWAIAIALIAPAVV